MSILDNIGSRYKDQGPQFINLWDFYLEDWESSSQPNDTTKKYNVSRFDVEDTSLPFPFSFTSEKYSTGKKYYTGVEFSTDFSVTIRENSNFTVYKYFEEWMSKIYNAEKGHFISSNEPKTKTGTILFYSFKFKEDSFNIFSKEYVTNKLKNAQVTSSQTLIQQAKKQASKIIPYPMSMITSQLGSIASAGVQSATNTLMASQGLGSLFEEVVTATFSIQNVRILGVDDWSLSYGDGEQMKVKANFDSDRVIRLS